MNVGRRDLALLAAEMPDDVVVDRGDLFVEIRLGEWRHRVIATRRSGARFSERHPLSGRSGLTANKVGVTLASLDMQLAPLDAAWSSGPASDDLVRS